MIDRNKIAITLLIAILIAGSINSNAWTFTLFPMKQGYMGWDVNTSITVYNNLSHPITFKIYATNPAKHTRYNNSGIYDTLTNGKDMKEYKNFPDLSWIHFPVKITVPAKSNVTVPIDVSIPHLHKYSNKHYEALISIEPVENSTIKISLASRLLITTPAGGKIEKTPDISIWLLIIILAVLTIGKRK